MAARGQNIPAATNPAKEKVDEKKGKKQNRKWFYDASMKDRAIRSKNKRTATMVVKKTNSERMKLMIDL